MKSSFEWKTVEWAEAIMKTKQKHHRWTFCTNSKSIKPSIYQSKYIWRKFQHENTKQNDSPKIIYRRKSNLFKWKVWSTKGKAVSLLALLTQALPVIDLRDFCDHHTAEVLPFLQGTQVTILPSRTFCPQVPYFLTTVSSSDFSAYSLTHGDKGKMLTQHYEGHFA